MVNTDFEIALEGKKITVMLSEKLTATNVPELQPLLKQEITGGARQIVFDFARTTALDSSGIGLLIATHNTLAAAQGEVHLIHVSHDILKLLKSMRLADRLHAVAQ
jgi:anti-anti-sigma factor